MVNLSCCIDDCMRPILAREMCKPHYSRALKGEDPHTLGPIRNRAPSAAPLEDRFWIKVDRAGPMSEARPDLGSCWIWTASVKPNGYSQFAMRHEGKKLVVHAHRLAYELHVGPIPPGLQLDHLCRIRRCVRPSHLEPVTQQENLRRGRSGVWQTEKTHCPAGHPYSGANLALWKRADGGVSRQCRKCANAKSRERYHQRMAHDALRL